MRPVAMVLTVVVASFLLCVVLSGEADAAETVSYDEVSHVLTVLTDIGDHDDPSLRPWGAYIGDVRSIVVSEGVTSIGKGAFDGCGSTVSIQLPSTLRNVGTNAFGHCTSLSTLTVLSDGLVAGEGAFLQAGIAGHGTKVTFGPGVTKVNRLFWGSERIVSVDLGSVQTVSDMAFHGMVDMEVELPSTLVTIGSRSFSGCRSVVSIDIGPDVATIGQDAFFGCSSVTRIVFSARSCGDLTEAGAFRDTGAEVSFTVGPQCRHVPSHLFMGVDISSIDIADSVSSIGERAFHGYDGPTFVLPPGVTDVGEEAFLDCTGLRSLTIGRSVQHIGRGAFDGCSELKEIVYSGSLVDLLPADVFFRNTGASGVSVRVSSVSKVPDNLFLGLSGMVSLGLDNFVSELGSSSFAFCTSLREAHLNRVTVVGEDCFLGCGSLDTISTVMESVSFGDGSFRMCGLRALSLPGCQIGESAFSGNPLGSVVFNGPVVCGQRSFSDIASSFSVTFMDSDIVLDAGTSFLGCDGPTFVFRCDTVPDSLLKSFPGTFSVSIYSERIGRSSFEGCDGLMSITINDTVEAIGDRAFHGCCSLESLEVPRGVTSIGVSAFGAMSSLRDLVVHSSNAVIGPEHNVFGPAPEVVNVRIVGNVPANMFISDGTFRIGSIVFEETFSIGDRAFQGVSIDDIMFPDTLARIGAYSFAGSSLHSVSFGGDTVLSTGAFEGCTSLETASLMSLSSIPDSAFKGCTSLKDLSLGPYLVSVGERSFSGTGIGMIQFPYSLVHIGEEAFYECPHLSYVSFLAHGVSICDHAFMHCPIDKLEIQPGSHIGNGAFSVTDGARALVPDGVSGDIDLGCRMYTGQGQGGDVMVYDLTGLNYAGFMLFADSVPDVSLMDFGDHAFSGWVHDDGSAFVPGAGGTETVVYATWEGVGHDTGTLPVDPKVLGNTSLVLSFLSVAFALLALLYRRSP